jgi:predicted RND superfamily exporter protein
VTNAAAIQRDALASAPDGVTVQLTGLPALIVDEQRMLRRGLLTSSVASALAIVMLCLLMLRSLRQTIIAQVPLLCGVALTLAFVQLQLHEPEPDHVELRRGAARARHRLRGPHDLPLQRGAARRAGREPGDPRGGGRTGPAIVVGALVTAVAFVDHADDRVHGLRELGVITALGLAFMVLASLLVLPALLLRRAGAASPP